MRPSFTRLIRILPKAKTTSAIESITPSSKPTAGPNIVPPPLTRHQEAPARVTLIETFLRRKAEGLAKEQSGELPKGAGWPVNLRVEMPITKKLLSEVEEDARKKLKDIMKES